MKTTIARVAGAAVLFGLTWGFGYYVGANRSGTEMRQPGDSKLAPIPNLAPGASSSTTIGGVIAGKTDFGRQMSLHRYAESLDATAMPGAINEAMQLPLQYRNEALAVLFSRWAELDPKAAAEYANLLPKSTNPHLLLEAAVTAWARKDFSGAFAWVQSIKSKEAKNDALRYLANALAKSDPAGAIKLIKENVPVRERDLVYENVFRTWAGHDFAGAIAAAQGIADLGIRSRALRSALIVRADTEPREVLEFLRVSKLLELRASVGSIAISRWLERDLAAARDYVMNLPPSEMRVIQIGHVAEAMARRDPREALAWTDQVPESDREQAAQYVFWVWGSNDSKAAMEAARGLADEGLKEKAIARLLDTLILNDRTAAIDLLQDLPAGPTRDNTAIEIANWWAQEDPVKAAEWYMENAGLNESNGIFKIVAGWSGNDPEAAFKWVSGLPEGSRKGALLAQTMSPFMRNDPARATALIEKLPVETQRTAVEKFVVNWGNHDLRAAAEWAFTLRDENSKLNAIGALASFLGARNPADATRWIEKLPAGTGRDAAVANFAVTAAKADPEGAVAWATTIQDPNQSRNTVRNVFTTWLSKDPEAARIWLQSAKNVPVEMRMELQGIQASFLRE